MSAKLALSRQDDLLKKLAKFFDYKTNFQGSMKEFHEEYKDVSKLYDLLDVERAYQAGLHTHHEQWLPNTDFSCDLQSLVNKGYLGVVFDKSQENNNYTISLYFLTECGLEYVRDLEKSLIIKAWDKQPATTISLVFLVLNLALTLWNIYITWK